LAAKVTDARLFLSLAITAGITRARRTVRVLAEAADPLIDADSELLSGWHVWRRRTVWATFVAPGCRSRTGLGRPGGRAQDSLATCGRGRDGTARCRQPPPPLTTRLSATTSISYSRGKRHNGPISGARVLIRVLIPAVRDRPRVSTDPTTCLTTCANVDKDGRRRTCCRRLRSRGLAARSGAACCDAVEGVEVLLVGLKEGVEILLRGLDLRVGHALHNAIEV